jgi:hypothetical protein
MKNPIKLFIFFLSVFLASFAFFVSAQSDGSMSPADVETASTASAPVPAPAETSAPVEAAPRVAPSSAAITTSAPAIVSPERPKLPPPASVAPAPLPNLAPTPMPVPPTIPPPAVQAPEPASSFPSAPIALAVALVLVSYGIARMFSQNKADKREDKGNRCDHIKQLLERKKSTLEIITGTLSWKQILIDVLEKKIEAKKEELADEVTTVVVDEIVGEEGGRIIQSAKEVKDTYETLVENLEQAKKALEYFTNRQKQLMENVGKIESAYQTCLLGNSVFEGSSCLGAGLELFENELRQKLYRYASQEKDVFSSDGVLAKNFAEMAEVWKWLPTPKLPENGQSASLRFFLTEKGKAEYEKTLLPLHKKYLGDISCDELKLPEINGVVIYEDEWQVVAKD